MLDHRSTSDAVARSLWRFCYIIASATIHVLVSFCEPSSLPSMKPRLQQYYNIDAASSIIMDKPTLRQEPRVVYGPPKLFIISEQSNGGQGVDRVKLCNKRLLQASLLSQYQALLLLNLSSFSVSLWFQIVTCQIQLQTHTKT